MADRTRKISAHVTKEERELIDWFCAYDRRTMSDFIMKAVFAYLSRFKPKVPERYHPLFPDHRRDKGSSTDVE